MGVKKFTLPFQNEGTSTIKLYLEPMPEFFLIKPGQRVVIEATCDDASENLTFTVAPGDSIITVYAPGEISGFVDACVLLDGKRLEPDGN